jgi:hypothetical protein
VAFYNLKNKVASVDNSSLIVRYCRSNYCVRHLVTLHKRLYNTSKDILNLNSVA